MIGNRYKNDGKSVIKLSDLQKEAKNRVVQKYKTGEYLIETRKCDCGANIEDSDILSEKDRYGFNVQTRICKKCGLVMLNPCMNETSLSSFYANDYRELYNGEIKANNEIFNEQLTHGEAQYSFIEKSININRVKSVLEIGCGAGGILEVFKRKLPDAKIVGIDLGEAFLEYGRSKGLDLRNISASQLFISEKDKYDLIICSHSLEHFYDISKELKVISSLLSDRGILYIEVPGIRIIPKVYKDILRYLQNAHIRYFTLGTLSQIMRWNGFELVNGNEVVQSLFKKVVNVDENEKSEIKNYYSEIVSFLEDYEKHNFFNIYIRNPLSQVEFFRKIYMIRYKGNKSIWQ